MSVFSRTLSSVAVVDADLPVAERSLAPSQVRQGLILSIWEGMLTQVHITLTTGAFLTGFALLLGAGNITLGIVAALPFVIQPLQLLGAWLIERQGARKPLTVIGSLGRLTWLVLLLLPYLPLPPTSRLVLLVVMLTVSNGLITLCGNAWLHWMTDLVPIRLRGRYFATRNTALAAVAMMVNYGAGVWLDRMRGHEQQAYGYTVIFMLAIVCAAAGSVFLSRQPEPHMAQRERLPIREVVRRPLQHREFRRFMLLIMLWHVALGIAAPFFSAHALTTLRLPFKTLAMFDVIAAAISMTALGPWGQLADRIGQRRVLLICIAGVIILPWFWVFATPSMIWPLYANAVLSGIWWSGLNLALSNRLMEQVPASARGAYLAVFAAGTGLTYFLASLGAGSVADLMAGVQLNIAGLSINNYQALFIVSSLVRCATFLLGRKAL